MNEPSFRPDKLAEAYAAKDIGRLPDVHNILTPEELQVNMKNASLLQEGSVFGKKNGSGFFNTQNLKGPVNITETMNKGVNNVQSSTNKGPDATAAIIGTLKTDQKLLPTDTKKDIPRTTQVVDQSKQNYASPTSAIATSTVGGKGGSNPTGPATNPAPGPSASSKPQTTNPISTAPATSNVSKPAGQTTPKPQPQAPITVRMDPPKKESPKDDHNQDSFDLAQQKGQAYDDFDLDDNNHGGYRPTSSNYNYSASAVSQPKPGAKPATPTQQQPKPATPKQQPGRRPPADEVFDDDFDF